ncbi:MAG: hypothetical protein SF052_14920 [Bacteroidia bacterium]|nr:hypothetical protein [Bacteroidia bacterium]
MIPQRMILLIFGLSAGMVWGQPTTGTTRNQLPGETKIVLEESFDDNTRNWEIADTKQLTSEISEGFFQLKGKTPYSPAFLSQPIELDPSQNFSFETTITQSSGMKNMGYGICWGAKDDRQDWFAFLISSNGQYTILRKVREDYNEIKRWTESSNINGQGKPNTLRVLKNKDRMEFYINNKLVYMSQVEEMRGKKAGILLHGTMKIEVDDFVVKQEP